MSAAGLLRPRRRHASQYIALGLLAFTGTMMFTSQSLAAGGSSSAAAFQDIENSEAVLVGLGILLGVYALIITEVVHRTLAAAIGGLLAILALSWAILASSEVIFNPPLAIFRPSWAILKSSWATLRPSRHHVELSLGHLGPS